MIDKSEFDPEKMKTFFYYVLERHNIQMKKDSGEPYPWTSDKFLRENSFTCNRRMDDRTTKWLLENITYNKQLTLEDKFWRTIIFRIYNKIETAELIGLASPYFWDDYQNAADLLDSSESDPYTRAYSTRSIKYAYQDRYLNRNWKSSMLLHLVQTADIYDNKIPEPCMRTAQDCFEWLLLFKGVGNFLGLQILIDIMYLDGIPYDINSNQFVIAGPGAQTGIRFITFDNPQHSYEEYLHYIKDNFEELCQEYYDPEFKLSKIREDLHDPYAYCLTDVQNLFCEFSKYCYMQEDRYKRHRKYIPN